MAIKKTIAKKAVAKKVPVKKPVAKKAVAKKVPVKKPVAKKTTKRKTKGNSVPMTPKEIATANNEPWVTVISVDLDPDNIGNGAFELDFNDIFVARLYKAGYQGKTDYEVVDRWFTDICKNVVAENFEQWEANQPINARPREMDRRDLGDGRTEVS